MRPARLLLALALTLFARPALAQSPDETINVGFLTLDKVFNSELMAPYDIFHHTVFHAKPGMKVFTVGRAKKPVTSFEGLRIDVDYDLESAPRIDVLVVPSADTNMTTDLEDERLIAWVRKRGAEADCVMSICDGAFLLAEAGLLDGHRCTTFPGDIPAFRKRYPQLTVVEGARFVADGKTITGVGGGRSYAPALYLVERLYGKKAADGVSRGMVLGWDLEQVRHLALDRQAPAPTCYLPGDRVDTSLTVEEASGAAVSLAKIVARHPGTKAVVMTIIAGGEAKAAANRGGIWCEDSFNEVANLRHLHLRYAEEDVLFLGVMCPPVHHETNFGYEEGAFARVDRDPVFVRNRTRLVESTEKLSGILPFDEIVYDPHFRLLADPVSAGAPSWAGRFKWFQDSQTYGTPTIWVLKPDGLVLGPPFYMNVYESPGRKLRYTPDDVADLIEITRRHGAE